MQLRGVGDDPVIYYTDPMKLLTHLNEVHGAEAVNGMAGLMAWCQAPTRALGRFDAAQPPKTLDEMYACATNEFERQAINDILFGSVSDVLDRYLPDREKHGALRGMLAFLAVNTTYRGPATPGSAAALAFGLAVPDENATLIKKFRGGMGAVTEHLLQMSTAAGGQLRLRSKVDEILVSDGRVCGVRLDDGERCGGRLRCRTGSHRQRPGRPRRDAGRHPGTVLAHRSSGKLPADALRAGRTADVRRALRGAQRSRLPVGHWDIQHARRVAAAVGGFGARDRSRRPRDRTADTVGERSRPGAARQARGLGVLAVVPDRAERIELRGHEGRDGSAGDREDHPAGPGLREPDHAPHHIHPQTHGHDVRCPGWRLLPRPDSSRADGPQPSRGERVCGPTDSLDGLYLASAGCHGGPGITFIPGYNAAQQVLADRG